MAHTDKDERCHCRQQVPGTCPHCGQRGNADDFARCHREGLGLKPAAVAERRSRFILSEWRGTVRAGRRDVKHRLRRLARRRPI